MAADQLVVGQARLQVLAQRYPGLQVSDSASLVTATDADRELNHWLGPFFVAMLFAFTSIAVVNTLMMIALRRRRELALLRLTGATTRQQLLQNLLYWHVDRPIVQVSGAVTVSGPTQLATFNATAETNTPATFVRYRWDFGDGSPKSQR